MNPALPLLLLATLARAATPDDYAYVFPIFASGAESAWRIDATPEVYQWSHDEELGDVEIFNHAGKPVPMARVAARGVSAETSHHAALPVFDVPPDESLRGDLNLVVVRDDAGRLRRIDERWHHTTPPREWLIDASAFTHDLDRLTLEWPGTDNVVMRVSVESSDDLQSWSFIGSGTVLSLERGGTRIERRDLPLRAARATYLRVRRLDDGAPVNELSATAHGSETGYEFPQRTWLDGVERTAEAAPAGVTRFEYALNAAVPVDAMRVEFTQDNALATFEMSGRWDPQHPWTPLGTLTAFRLRPDGEVVTNDEQHLTPRGRFREFRLEARTPVSDAPHVSIGYVPARFVFLAEGKQPWALAVGHLHARTAVWPIETALATMRASLGDDWEPPLAELGAPEQRAGEEAYREPPPETPWKKYVLWAVLLVGALTIAGFALTLLREAPPAT